MGPFFFMPVRYFLIFLELVHGKNIRKIFLRKPTSLNI